MTINTPDCSISTLPTSSQATTLILPVTICQHKCSGDGRLAFFIPWAAITLLGSLSSFGQPGSAFLIQATIPGLMAGASGLLLYKTTKKLVKHVRRQRVLASIRPKLAMVSVTKSH